MDEDGIIKRIISRMPANGARSFALTSSLGFNIIYSLPELVVMRWLQ